MSYKLSITNLFFISLVSVLLLAALSGSAEGATAARLYVADYDDNMVYVVDPATGGYLKNISVGSHPVKVITDPTATLAYVLTEGDSNISVISIDRDKVLRTFASGDNPTSMAISPDGQWLYISSSANSRVYVINTTSGNKDKELHVGSGPTGISFTSDGMACLVNAADGTVMVIDSNGRKPVKTLNIDPGAWPEEIAIDPYDRIAMVPGMSDGSITIIETNGWSIVSRARIGGNPLNIVYDITSGVFYVSDMTAGKVLAVDPQGQATTVASIVSPRSLVAESHGSRIFVASPDNGTISVITVTDSQKPVTYRIGHKPTSIVPIYMDESGLPVATATPIPTPASTTVTLTPTPTMLPHPTVTSTPEATPTPTPTPAPTSMVLPLLAIGAAVAGLALKRRD